MTLDLPHKTMNGNTSLTMSRSLTDAFMTVM